MRHFDQLTPEVRSRLFAHEPADFDTDSDIRLLSRALGATLYMPGSRSDLIEAVDKVALLGVRAVVLDLEDAVDDGLVDRAVAGVIDCVRGLSVRSSARPEAGHETLTSDNASTPPVLLFIRVRHDDHIRQITAGLDPASAAALCGFVLPKFSPLRGAESLAAIRSSGVTLGRRLLAMPVLETADVIYQERRVASLGRIRDVLAEFHDLILAVRLGTTDLCGLFGIRRDRDMSIYDVRVVADLISDTVNQLGRQGPENYAISGPVWEYFSHHERLFRPLLRMTPFVESHEEALRHRLITREFDDLIREVVLDRANGLTGKTVIHPTHAAPIHALSVVSFEEYSDAADILQLGTGVRASGYKDKMNEARPHRYWAEQVMQRAQAFGVASPDTSFVDLLAALAGT